MSSGTDGMFKRERPGVDQTPTIAEVKAAAPVFKKYDSGKPTISLIPRVAVEQEALAFAYGAKKYGKHNYKTGTQWTRYSDAAMRHILAFLDKEESDPESKLSHLAHARASLAMLMYLVDAKVGEDDR